MSGARGSDGDLGIEVLLITDDLRVVSHVADRVLVVHNGEVCERASVARVSQGPVRRFSRFDARS